MCFSKHYIVCFNCKTFPVLGYHELKNRFWIQTAMALPLIGHPTSPSHWRCLYLSSLTCTERATLKVVLAKDGHTSNYTCVLHPCIFLQCDVNTSSLGEQKNAMQLPRLSHTQQRTPTAWLSLRTCAFEIRLPDLASKNTGKPITFAFQKDNRQFFSVYLRYCMGHTDTKRLFVASLKFKF